MSGSKSYVFTLTGERLFRHERPLALVTNCKELNQTRLIQTAKNLLDS